MDQPDEILLGVQPGLCQDDHHYRALWIRIPGQQWKTGDNTAHRQVLQVRHIDR